MYVTICRAMESHLRLQGLPHIARKKLQYIAPNVSHSSY